jgi:hypothetical protein
LDVRDNEAVRQRLFENWLLDVQRQRLRAVPFQVERERLSMIFMDERERLPMPLQANKGTLADVITGRKGTLDNDAIVG